jgi:hypothetical protein
LPPNYQFPVAAPVPAPHPPWGPAPHGGPADSVWAVMHTFPNVESLIFVVPENRYLYAEFIQKMERVMGDLRAERERWDVSDVQWRWPGVTVAFRCPGGGLREVVLDGEGG